MFLHDIVNEKTGYMDALPCDFLSIILAFLLRNKANQSSPSYVEDLLKYA